MKVSLWQQFSSNHSATFSIVGRFDSAAKADDAANELRHILSVINDWCDAHPELTKPWKGVGSRDMPPPTEPELQFSQQYGVEWSKTSIDWIRRAQISTFNELVFLDPRQSETYVSAYPFNAIMAKLGGDVGVHGDVMWRPSVRQRLHFEVSAQAPDEATAEKLLGVIEPFLTTPRIHFHENPRLLFPPAPWELYGSRYRGADILNILKVLPQDKPHSYEIHTPDFVKALIPLLEAYTLDDELLATFAEAVYRLADQGLDVFIQPDQITQDHLDHLFREHFYHSYYNAWGKATRSGLQLQLNPLHFASMADGLPALVRYLTDNGCTDIQYTFQESRGNNTPPASRSGSSPAETLLRVLEWLLPSNVPKLPKKK